MASSKTLTIGCTSKPLLRSSSPVTCYCWDATLGTVLVYDGFKYLYKFNVSDTPAREEKRINFTQISREKHVVNACYSRTFSAYLVFCSDLHVYVIKEIDFTYQCRFACDIKYAVFTTYLDDLNAFIAITNEQVSYFSIAFKTNIFRSTQYSSSITFECNVLSTVHAHDDNNWNKGYTAQMDDRIITTWDITDVCIFDCNQQLKAVHKLKGIGSREQILSSCLYHQPYDYVIAGYNSGEIKSWKIVPNNLSKKSLTFTFTGHSKAVTSIVKHSTESKIIITAAIDNSIRFWDIDTFQFLFDYTLPDTQFDSITLLSPSYFIAMQGKRTIHAGSFTSSLKFLYAHDSEVLGIDKVNDSESNTLSRVQLVLKNNSGLSIDCEKLRKYTYSDNRNVSAVALIYPPPICKRILSLTTCPFRTDMFFIHIDTGGFCQYTVREAEEDRRVFYIEKIVEAKQFIDSQRCPIDQQVSVIAFLDILPPNLDLDLKRNAEYSDEDDDDDDDEDDEDEEEEDDDEWNISEQEYDRRVQESQLMAFGSDKGTVFFVSLKGNFDRIYARFPLHRYGILSMCVVKSKHVGSERYLVSYSREGTLKVTTMRPQSIEQLKTIEIGCDIHRMVSFAHKLVMTTFKGELRVFSLKQAGELTITEFDSSSAVNPATILDSQASNGSSIVNSSCLNCGSDHEGQIETIDVDRQKKLLLTAARDNVVKIWNWKRMILFSIKLPDSLEGAAFFNQTSDIALFAAGRVFMLDYQIIAADIAEIQKEIQTQYVAVTKTATTNTAAVATAAASHVVKARATIEEYFANGMNLSFLVESATSNKKHLAILQSQSLLHSARKTLLSLSQAIRQMSSAASATSTPNKTDSAKKQYSRVDENATDEGSPKQSQLQQLHDSQRYSSPNVNGSFVSPHRRSKNSQVSFARNQSLHPSLGGGSSNNRLMQSIQLKSENDSSSQSPRRTSGALDSSQSSILASELLGQPVTKTPSVKLPQLRSNKRTVDLSLHQKDFRDGTHSIYDSGSTSTKNNNYNNSTPVSVKANKQKRHAKSIHTVGNSPLHYYSYSETKATVATKAATTSTSTNLSPTSSRFPEIISKKNSNNYGTGGSRNHSNEPLVDSKRVHQPLTRRQEFVCISALPKQLTSEKKQYQLSALEKYQQDRVRFQTKVQLSLSGERSINSLALINHLQNANSSLAGNHNLIPYNVPSMNLNQHRGFGGGQLHLHNRSRSNPSIG